MPTSRQLPNPVWTIAVICLMAASGLVLRMVGEPAWSDIRQGQPEIDLGRAGDAVSHGLLLGILGGLRTLVADFLWIRAHHWWEEKDLEETLALVRLTSTIDPRNLYFWINGARVIAYDMPRWRLEGINESGDLPAFVRRRVIREQAERSLRLLERARQFHPSEPLLVMEMAMVYLNRLEDPVRATSLYGRAARMEGAPFYTARIYAELLRRTGRPSAAYFWYREIYPSLPPDDIRAQREIVLLRIRELEHSLEISPESRLVE